MAEGGVGGGPGEQGRGSRGREPLVVSPLRGWDLEGLSGAPAQGLQFMSP